MGLRAAWRGLIGAETKASAVSALIASGTEGRAISPGDRPEKFAKEGFLQNVIVFRAIDEIARSVAMVPWRLFRVGDADRREIEQHPLLTLLARPNPMQAGAEFFEAIIGWYMIAGNAFMEAMGPERGAPQELWPKRPDLMRVVPGPVGIPEAYEFKMKGRAFRWPVDQLTGQSQILHLKTFHPLDHWYGLSPLAAAALEIDTHNAAGTWNYSLLKRGARPSGFLTLKQSDDTVPLTKEQVAELEVTLDAKFSGPTKAGRPMVLHGGFEWEQASFSAKDLDFLKGRHANARDIVSALGVPPMLLGIPGDNTYSNMREARMSFWEQMVIPLLRHLKGEFNGWLVPRFGDGLELDFDLDEIPAMTLRRERKFEMVQQADYMSINEKRAFVGWPPLEDGPRKPEDDVLIPATLLPLGADPLSSEPEDDEPITPEKARAEHELAYGPNRPALRPVS